MPGGANNQKWATMVDGLGEFELIGIVLAVLLVLGLCCGCCVRRCRRWTCRSNKGVPTSTPRSPLHPSPVVVLPSSPHQADHHQPLMRYYAQTTTIVGPLCAPMQPHTGAGDPSFSTFYPSSVATTPSAGGQWPAEYQIIHSAPSVTNASAVAIPYHADPPYPQAASGKGQLYSHNPNYR